MKLHFNPGTLLNKTHCGSELALLSEDTHAANAFAHTSALPHAHLQRIASTGLTQKKMYLAFMRFMHAQRGCPVLTKGY